MSSGNPGKKNEEFVYKSVLNGDLEVREDGTIWRVRMRHGGRGRAGQSISSPCTPVRAEHDSGELFQVRAMIDGLRITASANRLVYRHFIGPIPDGGTIKPVDGNLRNNHPDNLVLTFPQSIEERFWSKVRRSEGCWIWTAALTEDGYGRFDPGRDKRGVGAHRVSYELSVGPIPEGMEVCHRCDNPPCVRPDHLFLGTHTENVQDCAAKGRTSFQRLGAAHHRSKVDNDTFLLVREAHAKGDLSQSEIGQRFGLSQATVSRIVLAQVRT